MTTKSIVFVDSRISDYQSFIDGLSEPAEVFILDGGSDGVTQMAAYLKGRTGIDAIHIISHGSQGALYLGSTVLDSRNFDGYGIQLANIGSTLTPTGDILLYGCNVAQGDVGVQFITSLALATGAELAASADATGGTEFGGNSALEHATGSIETPAMLWNDLAELLAAGTGMITTDIGINTTDRGNSVAMQTDGKIIVAGASGYDFAVARYNSNGSLDTNFGIAGKIFTDIGLNTTDIGYSVALQLDGKIVIAGESIGDFAIARYNNNGSLDASFGTGGKITTDIGRNSIDKGRSLIIQADGKILVAGESGTDLGTDFAIVRYNPNGSLDTSFGLGGKVTTDFGGPFGGISGGNCITAQSDGKFIVVGSNFGTTGAINFALARYTADGRLDLSFGTSGKVTTDFGSGVDFAATVSMQPDGKIVVGGLSNSHSAIARYNVNGSLDTSFGIGGKVINLSDIGGGANDLKIAPDGKILVVGQTQVITTEYSAIFSLARLNTDGTFDESFDLDGKVETNFGRYGSASAVTIMNDSKVLVVGSSGNDFALARYNTNGSLDTTFDGFIYGQVITGSIANDIFSCTAFDDKIDGAAGIDTVTLNGSRSDHTLTKIAAGWTVSSSSGGTDTLQNVERLKFTDATVALDIDGNGGQAYRVYQAAFNRTPDAGGLGFWINTMDSGASLRNVAEGFVASAEFKALYGTNPTNTQIVNKLYENVLGRQGEIGGLTFWLGVLDSKADTVAGVLAAFSESAENQAGLVGVIGNGFAFTPYI